MAVRDNEIITTDVGKVRAVDFNYRFVGELNKIMEILGITEAIPVQDGAALKALKITGELESEPVAEGDVIPLSHYKTEEIDVGTIKLDKWRKSTTAEAIVKGGYDQAVGKTTDKMVRDIQKGIRKSLIDYMANGTGTATGTGLQAALAAGWGQLQTLFEDDSIETVYILNPLDIADYLGKAQITMQTAFGMNYVENFLGLGTVLTSSLVPKGTYYATAKENIKTYFVNVANGDLKKPFNLITDETGYIGISETSNNERATVEDLVMSGVTFFPERIDGIVVGTITSEGSNEGNNGKADNDGV